MNFADWTLEWKLRTPAEPAALFWGAAGYEYNDGGLVGGMGAGHG